MNVKGIVFQEKGKVAVVDREVGEPAEGQIRIAVKACGVCALDIYSFKGFPFGGDYPLSFGHEAVGVVDVVGPGVDEFAPGDNVFCAGGSTGMSEMTIVPASRCAKLPAGIDHRHYVGEPVVCVVNGLDAIQLVPGASVVVVGTGYMGLLNIQGAAQMLVGSLAACDLDQRRLELAEQFGADTVVNVGKLDQETALRELGGENGVDVVIETSGSQPGLNLATRLVRKGGTLSIFGWHRGERTIDGTDWHLGGYRILNTSPMIAPHFADYIRRAGTLMERGTFVQEKLVTHSAHFTEAQKLLETGREQGDGYIKGVVTF